MVATTQPSQKRWRKGQRLSEHPHFRAAYDFVLLREQAGENLDGLGNWWTQYQQANELGRQEMVRKIDMGRSKKSRQRRKPRNKRMTRVFIGLGSNLGGDIEGVYKNSKAQLDQALTTIAEQAQIKLIKVSSFYQTPAIGPGQQADFIAAAVIETTLSAYELLDFAKYLKPNRAEFVLSAGVPEHLIWIFFYMAK